MEIKSKTFLKLFDAILAADKEQSRQAARAVRKLLHSSRAGGRYRDIARIIENAPDKYVKIEEDFRRENFVIAVSVLYFLHNRENQPDFLFPWLFGLLQHDNGNIRHAAVRMIEHEIGPLTYHLRFPGEKPSLHEFTPEQADHSLFELFANLNNLAAGMWRPAYKRCKYISSLPSGPYKSVQMILAHLEDDCGRRYMARLERLCRESPRYFR